MQKGIDVSTWQGAIDWPKVKASGVEFAMIRLGYGNSTGDSCKVDKYYTKNVEGALEAGVDVGVYFYSYALNAGAAAKEAAFVLKQLKPYKGRLLYPVAYDLEDPSQRDLGRTVLTAMVVAFMETIEDGGYYAAFYSNTDWCKNRLNMADLTAYDLWLAQWAAKPTDAFKFGIWQSSSNGSVPGITGRVDMDTAYKDYPTIIKRAGLNGYKAPTTAPETPQEVPSAPTGTGTRQNIIAVAVAQLGAAEPTGDDKYIQWYNKNVLKTWSLALDSAWCAMWVSWVCAAAGVPADAVKPYCGCTTGMQWFKAEGVWQAAAAYGGKYTPQPGDLVFFSDKKDAASSSHTGVVEYAEGNTLHTIEGNTSNACKRRTYDLTDHYIIGYAVPKYEDSKEAIEMSKEELVALIRQIIQEENPVYEDLESVPACFKEQTKALLDAGAVNGGTDADTCATDVNLKADTLKAAIIAARYCDAKTAKNEG